MPLSHLNGNEYYVSYRTGTGNMGLTTYHYDARAYGSPEGQGYAIAMTQSGGSVRALKVGTARLNERR